MSELFSQAEPQHLERIELRNFTVFEQAALDLVAGLNVIVGANATGKTHLLRAIHAGTRKDSTAQERLLKTFGADSPRQLLRWGADTGRLTLSWTVARWDVALKEGAVEPVSQHGDLPASVFVPLREWLSLASRLAGLQVADYDLGLDGATRDHLRALLVGLNSVDEGLVQAIETTLVQHLEGELRQKSGGDFFLQVGQHPLEVQLAAEGMRKLWSLAHLVRTGHIRKGTVLLWDEPTSDLNPALSTLVVETLKTLVRGGVQVVLTTHDYVLATRLTFLSEYPDEPPLPVRFFACHRSPLQAPAQVEATDRFTRLSHNPLVAEFARLWEDEMKADWKRP
jgi:ABC-type transport system involved in cytochrome c biogenesis ATPase subunit